MEEQIHLALDILATVTTQELAALTEQLEGGSSSKHFNVNIILSCKVDF